MNWKVLLAGLVYVLSYGVLMMYCEQNEFPYIFIHYAFCFLAFTFIIYERKRVSLKWLIVLGVLLRMFSIFIFPNLSDDIYRFFWDGKLWLQGIHPFGFTPSQLMESNEIGEELRSIYPSLNSQEYYTIYPPVLQFIFFIATAIGKTVGGTALLMKILYVCFDILAVYGLIKILEALEMDRKLSIVYFLNPLIVVELIGNIHAEVLMVCGLIWMSYFLIKEKYWLAGLFYGFAILAKILPFLIGPLLLLYLIKKKRWLSFFASAGIFVVFGFATMLYGSDISHLMESMDLYFRSFEFNASFYYIGRWFGYLRLDYNRIAVLGPMLAMISLGFILFFSSKIYKNPQLKTLLSTIALLFFIYLIFSTTIHPWYLAIPIAFAVFNDKFVFPIILWSFLVMLSYSGYDTNPVQEHPLLLWLEYGLLFGAIIYGSLKNPIKI